MSNAIDAAALLEYGVTMQKVEQALKDSNINTSGGLAVAMGEPAHYVQGRSLFRRDSPMSLFDSALFRQALMP